MPWWVRAVVRRWQSSLRLRVVTSTVVLGLVVVSVLGIYLFQSVADGLRQDRINSAQAEALALSNRAQSLFDETAETQNTTELNYFATGLITREMAPPPTDISRYVVFERAATNRSTTVILDTVLSGGLAASELAAQEVIPESLRQAVAADPGHQRTTVVEFTRPPSEGDPSPHPQAPAVVIGSQVTVPTAGAYDLFFIYPMDREQSTLDLIGRLFLLGGVALVTLVGATAWIVTQQVVSPVQQTARSARRLSLGNLNDRVRIRGHDDLAQLGRSFNDMADHLQSQIRQLEDLSRVQQVFVSDVSHELRTPLTTIRMAADVIHDARGEFAPGVARSAELLNTQLDRFEELLSDLLEISRFDAGAAALEADPVELTSIVRRVVQACEPLAERRGSVVEIRGPRGVVAEVDAIRVERIVRNLVVNAIEHGDGGPITIRIGQNATAVAISVRDLGVGLRPGESSLVFNRFWRADPARARTTGGTGLGLAISLEDARLHRGWLQAWGEPGEGSVFRLTLPRVAGTPIGDSPLPLAPPPPEPDGDAVTAGLRPYKPPPVLT